MKSRCQSDLMDSKGEMLSNLAEEFDRCPGVVVIIDAQDAKACRFIDGGELVEALTSSSDPRNEFHIELDRAAGNLQRGIGRLGARAILLLRYLSNVVAMKKFKN